MSLRQSAAQGRTIGDLMPEQLVGLAKTVLRNQSSPILQRMGSQLSDPVLRAQVVKGILGGVDHFLETLGPVGAMARGFLEMDTFEQKIGVYLDEKEEDLVAWLRNPEVQERMMSVLEENIDTLLHKRLDALLADMDEARLAAICQSCATQVARRFQERGRAHRPESIAPCGPGKSAGWRQATAWRSGRSIFSWR